MLKECGMLISKLPFTTEPVHAFAGLVSLARQQMDCCCAPTDMLWGQYDMAHCVCLLSAQCIGTTQNGRAWHVMQHSLG